MRRDAGFSILLVWSVSACAHGPHPPEPAPAFSVLERADIANNCFGGLPKWSAGQPPGPMDWIVRTGYVLEHSAVDKVALVVCERVDRANLSGDAARKDPFAPDPQLKKGRRAELSDYKGSGYSRGHQAPSADQRADQARNDETFYLSNMTPQLQALNAGIWEKLEKRVRSWAAVHETVWVLTGPMFDAATPRQTIGENAVAVPTHYFKVVITHIDGSLRATGFVFKHEKYPSSFDLKDAIQPIDWIEEKTGLDLMPELSPAEQEALEREPGALWP